MLLYNRMQEFVKLNPTRFFMPGHKGGYSLEDCFLKRVMPYDLTELSKTGNLFDSEGIIKEAQDEAAKMLDVHGVYYLAGGATLGIYAALSMCKKPGGKVIVDRGCHKSVFGALILLDLQPVFIEPKIIDHFGVQDVVLESHVEKCLIENPDACAVVITSPSYYGVVSDTEDIHNITKKYGVSLITDAAHGGNLLFMKDKFRLCGDFVVVSMHKTLPALTGAGILIVNDTGICGREVLNAISIFSTSSPSYLILASVDFSLFYMHKHGEALIYNLIKNIGDFKESVLKSTRFKILTAESYDPTRVVINTGSLGISGHELYNVLEEKYNITCEMADKKNVVLIPSVLSQKDEFESLSKALLEIDKDLGISDFEESGASVFDCPKLYIDMRTAFFSKKKLMKTKDSLGEISGEIKCVYPPGIAFLLPGQDIDINIQRILLENNIDEILTLDFN